MALKTFNTSLSTFANTVYTCPVGTEASVHGLVISNNTDVDASYILSFYKSSTAVTTTLASAFVVPGRKSVSWPKPINFQPSDYIQMSASANNALAAGASVYEGTTTTQGFSLKGAWSSGASYITNDIVTYLGTSYGAIQSSTNITPTTSNTAYWQIVSAAGSASGAYYVFSTTTTDSDPGVGTVRFNNATIGSVTQLYFDNTDYNGLTFTTWLDTFDDSTSTVVSRGIIYIRGSDTTTNTIAVFKVTGAVVDGTGYRKVPVSYVSGTLPTNGQSLSVAFSPAGDKGDTGAFGPKAVSVTNPTSSENISLFYTPQQLTITESRAVVVGTTPSVTYSVSSGSNRASATTTHVSAAVVSNTSTGTAATIATATIPANTWVWLTTSATSGTVTNFSLTLSLA